MGKSAFATAAFLAFARQREPSPVLHAGVLDAGGETAFPYLIARRRNELWPEGANFLISPICLSGPSRLDLDAVLDRISSELGGFDVVGGFLQTRDNEFAARGHCQTRDFDAFIDERTNYRLPPGLDGERWLAAMKRDSRGRARKWLRRGDAVSIVRIDHGDDSRVEAFEAMYDKTARTSNFADAYRFASGAFAGLLADRRWVLHLLYVDGDLAAGSIVGEVPGGHDYTFMAHGDEPDVSRANVIFLYRDIARSAGFLDLGGGIREGDSLARFKAGLGGIPTPFARVRFVTRDRPREAASSVLEDRWP